MHISLDSALGRQKRLNSVGESVLQIAPDAAAAYSLRSLTGGDPDVVRVRRESDNTEKDFSGSQIESGEMARWVNEQPTLPLDLRELDTNTGERDGALIEAAAAYSLRKLKEDFTGDVVEVRRNVDGETEGFTADEVTDGTLESFVNASFDEELPLDQATGAAAAYSLRNLSSSFTGDVVEVRRSSDDTVKSFTASEVADGTLEDWVNTDVTAYTQTGELNIPAGSGTFVTLPSYAVENTIGHTFRISFKLKRNTGGLGTSGAISVRTISTWNYTTLEKSSNLTEKPNRFEINTSTEEYQTYSFACSTSAGSNEGFLRFQTYDSNDSYTVKDFNVEVIESNGHVRTWYDQSGSDNHAVQTTSANQPKIVDGGTLLKDGNLNPSIKFTTADATFMTASGVSTTQPYSFFLKVQADKSANTQQLIDSTVGNSAFVQVRTDGIIAYNNGINILTSTDLDNVDADFIHSGFVNGSSTDAFTDGASALTDTDVGSNGLSGLTIGKHRTLSANYFDGQFSELIIYDSDQSTKRRAIEENIANHYDISLAAFSRDGTVSTWYDQSETSGVPNANHATQTDPTKQPKVVDAGTYLGEVDFDGVDDELSTSSSFAPDQPITSFIVSNIGNTGSYFSFGATTTDFRFITSSAGLAAFNAGAAITSDVTVTGEETLLTAIGNTTASSIFKNGTLTGSGDIGTAPTGLDEGLKIGNWHISDRFADGTIKELIIYNSDQSDNRTAIEANIGETYGITDIPAADDTVNGYVQTWYDQSGNVPANDAVQTTAANQPKIVINGVRAVGGMRFDDNQFLETADTFTYGSGTTLSTFLVNSSDGDESAYLFRFVSDYIVYNTGGGGRRVFAGTNANAGNVTGDEELWTTISELNTAGGTSNFYVDGTLASAADAPIGTKTVSNRVLNIGGSGTTTHWNGTANEVILYAADQSSKRTDIETNIINHYDI